MDPQQITSVIEAFLDVLASTRTENTVRWYRDKLNNLANYLQTHALPTAMRDIRPEHLLKFLGFLHKERRVSAATLRGYRVAIRHLWRWYYEYEGGPIGPEIDPLRGLPRPECPRRVPEALSSAEMEQLLATAAGNQRDSTILITLLATGMRASELVNLCLEDIDRRAGRILIRHAGYRRPAGTKRNCERYVPIKDTLRAVLSDYIVRIRPRLVPEGTPWLFATREGRPLTTEGLYRLVKRCLTRAGIQKSQMGPHLLRRTFASRLRAAGLSKTDIAELLGHTPSTGTKVVDQSYLSAEANEQALQAAPDPLAGLSGWGRLRR